jgi:hypothetical protein
MLLEAAVIARVEMFIRHPAFVGSDQVMEGVLEDLEGKVEARQISPQEFARLRRLLLASPHFRMN